LSSGLEIPPQEVTKKGGRSFVAERAMGDGSQDS